MVFTPANNDDFSNALAYYFGDSSKVSLLTNYNLSEIGTFAASPSTIGSWDTSNVTDMSYAFESQVSFNEDIGNWDTSNVTDMRHMFNEAVAFNQNINTKLVNNSDGTTYLAWDTLNVENMSYMFAQTYNTTSFNNDIGYWNTSKVLNMQGMFGYNIPFNKDISTKEVVFDNITYTAWNTSNVTDMSFMFNANTSFNQDISNWNTSSVTSINQMFQSATVFNKNIRTWIIQSGTTLTDMILYATAMNNKYTGTTGFGTTPDASFFNIGIFTPTTAKILNTFGILFWRFN